MHEPWQEIDTLQCSQGLTIDCDGTGLCDGGLKLFQDHDINAFCAKQMCQREPGRAGTTDGHRRSIVFHYQASSLNQ